jgi:hypothetical protein
VLCDKGYVAAGQTGSSSGTYRNDVWQYDPVTNSWTQKANYGGGNRTGPVAMALGGKGYMGTGYNGTAATQDFWEYNPASDAWLQLANFGGSSRYSACAFTAASRAFLATGYSSVYFQDTWEFTPVDAFITPSGALCPGGSITLSAVASTGFSYQWQLNGSNIPGATNNTHVTSTAGDYSCMLTNACGSLTTRTLTVTTYNPSAPVITASGGTALCTGGSVTLSAPVVSGASYQWKLSGADIAGATAGSYTVTFVNAGSYTCLVTSSCGSGLSNTIVVTTTVPTAVITAGGNTNICWNATLSLYATTGTGYTYQWKRFGADITGATTSSYTASGTSAAGDYTCLISNQQCSSLSNSITITTTGGHPDGSISASGPIVGCSGTGATTLNAVYDSQNFYQWKRNDTAIAGATAFSYVATQSGNYSCAVTNVCGTSQATDLPVNFEPVEMDCGSAQSFYSTNNDYSFWQGYNCGTTGNSAHEKMFRFTPTISGNYNVSIYSYVCGISSAAQWFYKPLGGSCDTAGWTCLGTAGNFSTYTVPKTFVMGPLFAGTTYLLLVDAVKPTKADGGFISLSTAFRMDCPLCSTAPVSISTSASNNTVCSGNSITLTQNGGILNLNGDYFWYAGSCGGTPVGSGSSITVSPTATTTYYVRGESTCGNTVCVPVTVYVDASLPTASISMSGSTTICQGTTVALTAVSAATYSYQWQKNGTDIAGATSQVYAAGSAGVYSCRVTNSCGSQPSNTIQIATEPCNMGILFGGDYTRVEIPHINAYNVGTGDFTFEARVRCIGSTLSTDATIFGNATTYTNGFAVSLNSTQLRIKLNDTFYTVNAPGASNDTCHHVAIVRSGTTLLFYMDGNLLGTRTAGIYNITMNYEFFIGGGPYFYNRPFSGRVRDVAFWNIAASQAQVQSSMNTGLSGAETGLIGYWKLDEGSGQVANDLSSLNNDGFLGSSLSVDISDPVYMASCQCLAPGAITAAGPTTFCPGGSVTMAVNPGSGQTYQWQLNGTDISGATSVVYTAIAGGNYACVITDACGPHVSNIIAVTVTSTLPPASISAGSATTFCSGGNVMLSANAGTGLSWQWQRNGADISGATGSMYAATVTGSYTCILSNNCGSATSNAVSVTVNTPPSISQQPANAFVCAGSNTSISLVVAGTGLTYQWKENGNNLSNGAVYGGATTATLSFTGTPANLDLKQYTCSVSGTCPPSVTSTAATLSVGSATPAIVISGNGTLCSGAIGNFTALPQNAGLAPAYQWKKNGVNVGTNSLAYSTSGLVNGDVITCTLTTNDPCSQVSVSSNAITIAIISTSPPATITTDRTETCEGIFLMPAHLSANTGPGLTYQWKSYGFNISGATASTYTAYQSGQYTCLVSNSCGSTLSNAVSFMVWTTPSPTISAGGTTTFCPGGSVVLSSQGTGIGVQWAKNGVNIPGATGLSYTASTSGVLRYVFMERTMHEEFQ